MPPTEDSHYEESVQVEHGSQIEEQNYFQEQPIQVRQKRPRAARQVSLTDGTKENSQNNMAGLNSPTASEPPKTFTEESVQLRQKRFIVSRQNSRLEDQFNRREVHSVMSNRSHSNGRMNHRVSAPPERLKANIGSKNGNMVLKLVLPSDGQNSSNFENSNYLTTSSIEEILGRGRHVGSQQDLYSLGNECYINGGYENDLPSYTRSFSSGSGPQIEVPTPLSEEEKATPPEEKKRNFRNRLTKILSSMYTLFICTLGIVVYFHDIVEDSSIIVEVFNLYLIIIDLVFILYLIIDVNMYMKKKNYYNNLMRMNASEEIEMKQTVNGEYQLEIKLPKAAGITKELQHHYCLKKDQHSANFYLKIGAAGFCVGHLIHSGLLLGYQIMFLASVGDSFYKCATLVTLVLDVIYPIYSFLLLYFIFKYSNIIINRHIALVRFGLMHCIASSLCFWMWTIIRETMESMYLKTHSESEDDDKDEHGISEVTFLGGQPVALPLNSYSREGAQVLTRFLNINARQFIGSCQVDAGLNLIYKNYSPFLYPFTVEYSILVVGVLFVIWQSIGKCKEKQEMSTTRQCDTPEGSDGDNLESNVAVHVDCHSANKGLFAGIVVMVATVVSIILFFIVLNDPIYENQALVLNIYSSIFLLVITIIAVLIAFRQITKLDISKDHISMLDDLLLFICVPAYFLNGIFSIIPAVAYDDALDISQIVLEMFFVLVQTPFIIDGLRRCSNTRELRRAKPGRELVTFLIVCNVAMWIMQTFEIKSNAIQDNRYEFYGKELWTVIGHMCLPLMMFYRFHSSVCLVDIWKLAYEASYH